MNPTAKQENKQKFITFSYGWDGMPIAYHLQEEGYESVVGQVESKKELGQEDDEKPEDRKQRMSQYDEMIKKYPAKKLMSALKKIKNKDDYFIFFDQNNLYTYAEELLKAGFSKGLFPTKKDYEFEKEREKAMEFVQENYPDVQIISHEKIKTVEEAKKIVEESEVPLVIQSEGDFVPTICPVDDLEQNRTEILSALEKYSSDYSKGEIIIKEKLVKPIEITPQIVFWNGQFCYTSLDIETKNIGDGENNGNQVGCGTNLIIKTEMDDEINKIAFPPKVFEMAKEHVGFFIWDISLYITDKGIFFGEFCSNRLGYDSSMTEMSMSGGVGMYFNAIQKAQNPLIERFGAAVRVFNLNRQKSSKITVESPGYTWLYEVKKDKDLVSLGDAWDLGVITGCGNTVEEAVDDCYENLDALSFKEKYTRTKFDFLADYPTSIMRRFKETNHVYYKAPIKEEPKQIEDENDLKEVAGEVKELSDKIDGGIEKIKSIVDGFVTARKTTDQMKVRIRDKIKNILHGD